MAPPLDATERAQLCDLFDELGPDAPTLCEGWKTIDLAAHLLIRERDPRTGLVIMGGNRFAELGDRMMARAKERGYEALVDAIRKGPPIGPFAIPGVRTFINLNEYFVHHEDVRRPNGRAPRTDRPDLDDALWSFVKRGARLQLRKAKGVRVELVAPGHGSVAVGSGPTATLTGAPGELTLYLNGRRGAAKVERSGDAEALQILEAAHLGI